MNQTQFVAEVYKIASAYIPAIDDSSSFQDVVKDLEDMKDKAMRWEILSSSFKPEPELPKIDMSQERFKKLAQERIGNT